VIVVRNGGPFDDNSIRQVIQPNSSLTSTGLFSTDHPYPSTQRNFKVSAAENADSNEVINVPTKDGSSWACRAPSTSTSTTPTRRS
jgi:hypothetical protein